MTYHKPMTGIVPLCPLMFSWYWKIQTKVFTTNKGLLTMLAGEHVCYRRITVQSSVTRGQEVTLRLNVRRAVFPSENS